MAGVGAYEEQGISQSEFYAYLSNKVMQLVYTLSIYINDHYSIQSETVNDLLIYINMMNTTSE